MQGGGHQRTPDQGENAEAQRASAPDDGEVVRRYRQHVAEEVAHQVVAKGAAGEGEHDEAQRQRGMREDSEQGVARDVGAAFEHHEQACDRNGGPEDSDSGSEADHYPECDPE